MTATQPILPADYPAPQPKTAPARKRADDYHEWIEKVRPVFEKVARSGRRFTSYEIANEYDLPDPPHPKSQWGRLIGILRDDGLIEKCGWADSERPGDNSSSVKVWRGTAAARAGRAA